MRALPAPPGSAQITLKEGPAEGKTRTPHQTRRRAGASPHEFRVPSHGALLPTSSRCAPGRIPFGPRSGWAPVPPVPLAPRAYLAAAAAAAETAAAAAAPREARASRRGLRAAGRPWLVCPLARGSALTGRAAWGGGQTEQSRTVGSRRDSGGDRLAWPGSRRCPPSRSGTRARRAEPRLLQPHPQSRAQPHPPPWGFRASAGERGALASDNRDALVL